MLIYHPAFDLYACVFRILRLMLNIKQAEVEVDRLRIWDFYLTFPNEARKIVFPNSLKELKKIFKGKQPNQYEDLIDAKKVIDRMKSFQLSALRSLASYGFIEKDFIETNRIRFTGKEIPNELKEELLKTTDEELNIIKLVTGFSELPLFGEAGLKSRTGLLEFKYDPK